MKHRLLLSVAIIFVCLFGFSSCDGSGHTITTEIPIVSNNAPTEHPQSNISTRIELPEIKNHRWFIQHTHYALEYDTAQRHSIWVAYVFHADYNQKNVSRRDAWAFDPFIPRQYQPFSTTSQIFPGYDRGHLIASEDRVFCEQANRETFYFSNISPQYPWFNRQLWANLEAAVRRWAQADGVDTLYVVTGGAINPGVEVIGTIENRNNVTIPKYYFKALVKRSGNNFDGIAFWMENKRHESNRPTHHQHSITIRELEQKTGINFFPNLRYICPNLEDAVETTRDTTKWRF